MTTTERFAIDERKYDRSISVVNAYARWLRFRVSGLGNVPHTGAALLIGNHAGLRLHDAFATAVAIRRTHPAHRILRGLAHRGLVERPAVAALQLEHMGGVIGTHENAKALLQDGWLVLTYPEGAKSTTRPFWDRDKVLPVETWGKGWARLALETEVPVIPVGVSGVEAAIPTLWRSSAWDERSACRTTFTPSPRSHLSSPFNRFWRHYSRYPCRAVWPWFADHARATTRRHRRPFRARSRPCARGHCTGETARRGTHMKSLADDQLDGSFRGSEA